MTHDKVLSLIDYYQVEGAWDVGIESERFEMLAKNYRALRLIVELCKVAGPGGMIAQELIMQEVRKELYA